MRQARLVLAAIGVLTIAGGCAGDLDVPRSDVSVWLINGGDALQSSVRNAGTDLIYGTEDDFITEDEVWVVFHNAPSDDQGTMESSGAFSAVTMNRYRVSFISDVPLDSISGGMHAYVRSGETTGVGVVVMPAFRKVIDPLVGIYNGTHQPIEATARLEFWGEEKTSGDNIYIEGFMPMNFNVFR